VDVLSWRLLSQFPRTPSSCMTDFSLLLTQFSSFPPNLMIIGVQGQVVNSSWVAWPQINILEGFGVKTPQVLNHSCSVYLGWPEQVDSHEYCSVSIKIIH
jgi:hypothetical protein